MSVNTNELSAMITQHILDKFEDGLQRRTALLSYVFDKGTEYLDGGTAIQFPIKLIANNTSGFINGTNDTISMNPAQQMVYGTVNWKYYVAPVSFTLQDETVSGGADQKAKYIAGKIQGAMDDAHREISQSFYATDDTAIDATANTKSFTGLKSITYATSYAGLTASDYTTGAYAPYLSNATTPNYLTVNAMINGLKARRQAVGSKDDRIFGLMNDAVFTKLQSNLQNQQLFIEDKDLFAAGTSVGFKINGIEFYLDADCPGTGAGGSDNWIILIPMDVLKFYYKFGLKEKQNKTFAGETRIPNQTINTYQHFLVGNLCCTNRRLIAVNKTIVA